MDRNCCLSHILFHRFSAVDAISQFEEQELEAAMAGELAAIVAWELDLTLVSSSD